MPLYPFRGQMAVLVQLDHRDCLVIRAVLDCRYAHLENGFNQFYFKYCTTTYQGARGMKGVPGDKGEQGLKGIPGADVIY